MGVDIKMKGDVVHICYYWIADVIYSYSFQLGSFKYTLSIC